MRSALAVAALVSLAACERPYVYLPTVNTSATVEGRLASYYPIPAEAPRGDVRVATFGIADLGTEGGGEAHALHVRMIVANNGDEPWTVDTREQRVALAGDGESRPAYASADQGAAPPAITIPPGQARTIDLFYPLPAGRDAAGDLPAFDTVWTVHAGAQVVTTRTPFERLAVRSAYDDDAYYWGTAWGPPYWYDPYYPTGAFVGVHISPGYGRGVYGARIHPHAPPARRVR